MFSRRRITPKFYILLGLAVTFIYVLKNTDLIYTPEEKADIAREFWQFFYNHKDYMKSSSMLYRQAYHCRLLNQNVLLSTHEFPVWQAYGDSCDILNPAVHRILIVGPAEYAIDVATELKVDVYYPDPFQFPVLDCEIEFFNENVVLFNVAWMIDSSLNCDKDLITVLEKQFNPKFFPLKRFRDQDEMDRPYVIVIQTDVVHLKYLEKYLNDRPEIYVIHLVADPRDEYYQETSIHSTLPTLDGTKSAWCSLLEEDIDIGNNLEYDRYTLIRYERMLYDRNSTVKQLHSNIRYPPKTSEVRNKLVEARNIHFRTYGGESNLNFNHFNYNQTWSADEDNVDIQDVCYHYMVKAGYV